MHAKGDAPLFCPTHQIATDQSGGRALPPPNYCWQPRLEAKPRKP